MRSAPAHHYKPEIKKDWSLKKQALVYTVLFLLAALGAYAVFLIYGKTLLRNGAGNVDGITQYYPSYTKLKNVFADWKSGSGIDPWSWDVGLGASFFDTFKGKLVSPLTYPIIAAPQKYLDVAYSLVSIFRQYLTGIAFLFFGKEVKLKADQNVFGALCYAFSGWAFRATIAQGSFTNAMIFLPLLIMGVDRILKKKSPFVFILAEFLFLSSNILWSYIAGLTCILYFVLRYPYYHGKKGLLREEDLAEDEQAEGKKRKLSRFPRMLLSFMGYGITGILISAIFVESMLFSTTSAITNTNYDVYQTLLYPWKNYILLPARLFGYTEFHTSYSFIFATVLVAMLLPLIIANAWKKRSTAAIMTIFFGMIGLFPYTGKILNGFSYSVGRWYFVLTFFYIWAAMEVFEHATLRRKRTFVTMFVWWFLLACYIMGFLIFVMRMLSHNNAWQSLTGLCLCFALMVVLYIREFRCGDDSAQKPKLYALTNVAIAFILIANISINSSIIMTGVGGDENEEGNVPMIERFADAGWAYDKFEKSTQHVVPTIQEEDSSFFRTDQVDGYNDARRVRVMANENIYFGNRSIYEYFSTISAGWLKFNHTVGNNAGYFRRTISYSNDNRPGLDYLMGVKYFLGDSVEREPGADKYVPYGYEFDRTIDGVNVFKNRYCMGLGTTYDQYITESELEKFSPLEREQVMLQALVVPDQEAAELKGIQHADVKSLETGVEELDITVKDSYGIENEVKADGGQMILKQNKETGSGFKIHIPEVKDRMIVVAFDKLIREELDWNQHMDILDKDRSDYPYGDFKYYLVSQEYHGDQSYRLTATYDDVMKSALSNKGQNQGLSDVDDFLLNLGYFENAGGDIDINIDKYGIYDYDAIHVYAVPMDIYEKYADSLDETKYNVTSFDGDSVKGTVDPEKDSILYLSILEDPGWKVYVDGKPADVIDNVNIAFIGVRVPAGQHKVTLEYHYPGLIPGLIATVLGLVILVVIMVKHRKKNRKTA